MLSGMICVRTINTFYDIKLICVVLYILKEYYRKTI